jgi:hypothetical protein
MRQWLLAAAMGLTACGAAGGGAGRGAVEIRYVIDAAFSEPQAEAIRLGMAFWEAELPRALLIEEPRAFCAKEQPRCIVSVVADDESLFDPEKGRYAAGMFHGQGAWTSLSKDMDLEIMPIISAHEFGHRLTLRHAAEGLMKETMGTATEWRLEADAIARLERIGLL